MIEKCAFLIPCLMPELPLHHPEDNLTGSEIRGGGGCTWAQRVFREATAPEMGVEVREIQLRDSAAPAISALPMRPTKAGPQAAV